MRKKLDPGDAACSGEAAIASDWNERNSLMLSLYIVSLFIDE
jgi:hypothetical protein